MTSIIRIALADDHHIFRTALADWLNQHGFTVTVSACDGQDLINQVKVSEMLPNICLTDIEMPVMNGYDTVLHLRKFYPSILVVAHTSFLSEAIRLHILQAGAEAVVEKHDNPQNLKKTLLELLEKRSLAL